MFAAEKWMFALEQCKGRTAVMMVIDREVEVDAMLQCEATGDPKESHAIPESEAQEGPKIEAAYTQEESFEQELVCKSNAGGKKMTMAEDAIKLRDWILDNAGLEAQSMPIATWILWLIDRERWEAYEREHTLSTWEEGVELVFSYLKAAQVAGSPAEEECLLSPCPPAEGGCLLVSPSEAEPHQSPAIEAEQHQSPAREAEQHQFPAKGGD
ncbi:UNVERIFIED_CONTAM: hypothetical protein FKN15_050768 [Acipenser sinensis]